jgi:hypothetical protein
MPFAEQLTDDVETEEKAAGRAIRDHELPF